MPKLYEYLEIVLFFIATDTSRYMYTVNTMAEKPQLRFAFCYGRISKIILKDKGQGLEPAKRKDFEQFVHAYAHEIVENG